MFLLCVFKLNNRNINDTGGGKQLVLWSLLETMFTRQQKRSVTSLVEAHTHTHTQGSKQRRLAAVSALRVAVWVFWSSEAGSAAWLQLCVLPNPRQPRDNGNRWSNTGHKDNNAAAIARLPKGGSFVELQMAE